MRWKAISLAAIVIVVAGCGGGGHNSATTSSTVTAAAAKAKSTATTAAAAAAAGFAGLATTGNCRRLADLSAQYAQALQGASSASVAKTSAVLKQFADKTPVQHPSRVRDGRVRLREGRVRAPGRPPQVGLRSQRGGDGEARQARKRDQHDAAHPGGDEDRHLGAEELRGEVAQPAATDGGCTGAGIVKETAAPPRDGSLPRCGRRAPPPGRGRSRARARCRRRCEPGRRARNARTSERGPRAPTPRRCPRRAPSTSLWRCSTCTATDPSDGVCRTAFVSRLNSTRSILSGATGAAASPSPYA